jgi:hypothetical protein
MVRGDVPYRDFSVEYPPGALPLFVLPAVGHEGDADPYRRVFERLMIVCAGGLVIALAFALGALRASAVRILAALTLAAIAPLLLGSVVLTRFDLWPASLAAAALAALLWQRFRLAHGLLGLGIVAKLWPGLLVPLAVAHVWRHRGRRDGLICAAITVGVVVAVVLPFFVLAPHGVWSSFERQLSRPLQIESVGASLLVASHHVFGTGVTMVSSRGSQNLAGSTAAAIGWLQTALQLCVVCAVWAVFALRRRSQEELVRFGAAAVVAFIAFGKVMSPQFLVWLIPVVPLVRRWSAAALFVAALVLTQAWFPQRYWSYALGFDETMTWLVVARDLVLVALLGALLIPPGAIRAAVRARGRRRVSSSPASA